MRDTGVDQMLKSAVTMATEFNGVTIMTKQTMIKRSQLKQLAASVSLLALAGGASAQAFPTKPITIVVGFAAGGPTDIVARTIAASMEKTLGQPVLVENKAGAGAIIGISDVARSRGDGYKLLVHHIGMATAPNLYRRLSFDPLRNFEYVGLINDVPMVMLTKLDMPVKNMSEMIAYVKANKNKVSFANAGVGSASHLCGLMFMSTIKTELTTVPYKGTAPAMTDLIGGQVDMLCDQTTSTTAFIKGGKVRPIALTTMRRLPTLPDIPTANESGLPGFSLSVWHGMYAPKDTPKPVMDKLVAALQVAVSDPAVRKRFDELGAETVTKERATPEALQKHLKAEIAKWGPIIRASGVYAD